MTEAEAIGALVDIDELAATYGSLWLSVTFGYLTVAYFLGKALSRFQCLMISVLYIVSALNYVGSVVGQTQAWELLVERERTIYDGVWLATGFSGWADGGALFYLAGTIIALYFMYNVRNSEKK